CNFSTVVLCNNASRPGAPPLDPRLARLLATRRSRLRCAPCLAAIASKPHNAITNNPQILQRVKRQKSTGLSHLPQEAEAQVGEADAGGVVEAERRPAVAGAAAAATATVDPVRA